MKERKKNRKKNGNVSTDPSVPKVPVVGCAYACNIRNRNRDVLPEDDTKI